MQIRYEVRPEDVAALNLYLWQSNRSLRRQARFARWALPVLLLSAGALSALSDRSLSPLFVFGIFGASYLLFSRRLQRRAVVKQSMGLLEEGDKGAILGDHQLEAGDAWLYESSALVQSRYSYEAIVKFVVTPERLFILTDTVRAMVVSRSGVVEGNFDMFAAAVQEKLDSLRAAQAGVQEEPVVLHAEGVGVVGHRAVSGGACGAASFAIAIIAAVLLGLVFAAATAFGGLGPGGGELCQEAAIGIGLSVMLVFLCNVVGLVLGIAGLGQSRHRVLAAMGLAFNLLFVLGFLGLFILAAVLGRV
jgi:hypothetical protein